MRIIRMIQLDDIVLGFDPGGNRNFGVAFLIGAAGKAATVSSVADAIDWVVQQCGRTDPLAAGIDTLLHWSDGESGWRPADRLLIENYVVTAKSVVSPNSLYGAMAIGGMALALRLRERWPAIILNETHPKVLVPALGGPKYADKCPAAAISWFGEHSGHDTSGIRNGHEFDALLSAWATQQGIEKGWSDLVGDGPALLHPAGLVSYAWPEPLRGAMMAVINDQQSPKPKRAAGKLRESRGTTDIGFRNRNQQIVIQKTDLAGSDHGQKVYVLRCGVCGHEYGANGSDIWLRRCPKHDGGMPGLAT